MDKYKFEQKKKIRKKRSNNTFFNTATFSVKLSTDVVHTSTNDHEAISSMSRLRARTSCLRPSTAVIVSYLVSLGIARTLCRILLIEWVERNYWSQSQHWVFLIHIVKVDKGNFGMPKLNKKEKKNTWDSKIARKKAYLVDCRRSGIALSRSSGILHCRRSHRYSLIRFGLYLSEFVRKSLPTRVRLNRIRVELIAYLIKAAIVLWNWERGSRWRGEFWLRGTSIEPPLVLVQEVLEAVRGGF